MTFTYYLLLFPGAFLAPIIHEFTKARVAAAFGDVTIKKQGLYNFSPKKFFEPIGFFFLMHFNVGWGQPVQISPLYFKDKRKGILFTYVVPMLVNILVGLFVLFFLRGVMFGISANAISAAAEGNMVWLPNVLVHINTGLFLFAQTSIGLAVFNLLPINPLAASKILPLILSPDASVRMTYYEKPLQVIMIIMLVFGFIQMLVFPIRDSIMAIAGPMF